LLIDDRNLAIFEASCRKEPVPRAMVHQPGQLSSPVFQAISTAVGQHSEIERPVCSKDREPHRGGSSVLFGELRRDVHSDHVNDRTHLSNRQSFANDACFGETQ
jgi:hypothetical protein